MSRLVLINGTPGSGKSTLARRLAADPAISPPLTLVLDIDVVRGMLGRWLETPGDAGMLARRHALAMIDQQIDIATKDGRMTTFITHPERGGPYPVVLFFMDAPGIREDLRDMARRLATAGYYVMLPNLYYRSGEMELGPIPREEDAPLRKKMFDLMYSIDIPRVMQDTRALLDFAATQPAASKGPAGAMGYCMSGRYAINAAANFPGRIAAAAQAARADALPAFEAALQDVYTRQAQEIRA